MKTYISLLRGINVSGKNSLKMDILKQLCVDSGLINVQTYIQSGNLVYQSMECDETVLTQKIHQTILDQVGLDIPILTKEATVFKTIVAAHPFVQEEELAQLYLTFFDRFSFEEGMPLVQAKRATEEIVHFTQEAAYLVATKGYGQTKITNALIENKLKVIATTRNYRTCIKLIKLAETLN